MLQYCLITLPQWNIICYWPLSLAQFKPIDIVVYTTILNDLDCLPKLQDKVGFLGNKIIMSLYAELKTITYPGTLAWVVGYYNKLFYNTVQRFRICKEVLECPTIYLKKKNNSRLFPDSYNFTNFWTFLFFPFRQIWWIFKMLLNDFSFPYSFMVFQFE